MSAENYAELAQKMRAEFKKNDDERDAGLPTEVAGVKRFDNIVYGEDEKFNLLDIYLPEDHSDFTPVIVNVHGGGWVYGTKETYQFYCLFLAQHGFAVVNANYRLAPSVVFPQELNDINRVFHWLEVNASKYYLDLNNVFVVGDSAGGQMGEQILAAYTNANYRKYFGYTVPNLKIKAAALNCGAYFVLDTGVIVGGVQAYFPPQIVIDKYDQLNVEKYITPDFPPVFLMTATNDFLRNNAYLLSGYLRANNIIHEIHMYGDESNPRGHDFHINQKDSLAEKCNLDELEFFRQYID